MLDVDAVIKMHREMVIGWHQRPIDNPFRDFLALACKQFAFNFRLWHEEDIARSPDVEDREIARVKRAIDQLNQQRNDAIEEMDDWILEQLIQLGVSTPKDTPMNTETPGSVIDRLSILALRIYHLEEQLTREDVDRQHICSVQGKLTVCHQQQEDLGNSLVDLLADITSGRKRHRTYRQHKMYNDPTLNPYLYAAEGRQSLAPPVGAKPTHWPKAS